MSLPTSFFIGKGGGAAPLTEFDNYGVAGGTIAGISEVFNYGYDPSVNTGNATYSTAILEAPWSSNPKQAALVTSASGGGNIVPKAIYPNMNSGYSWENASQSSHFTYANLNEGQSSDTSYYDSIGGAHITDTTGTHVVSKFIQWCGQAASDYNVYTYYGYKGASSSNWSQGSFQTTISSGSGLGASTRFNTSMHSTQRFTAQVGKDQNGYTSGNNSNSGQPTYVVAREIDSNNQLGSYEKDDYFFYDTSHNTHGSSDRGMFLGGYADSTYYWSFYYIQYHDHNNASKDGYRMLRVRQDIATSSNITFDISDHQSIPANNVVADGGKMWVSSQTYPHAFIQYSAFSGHSYSSNEDSYVYYVDLSQTWSSSTGLTRHLVSNNNKDKYISRVGGTTADPVFAMLVGVNDLYIRQFNTSNKTWTNIAYQSIDDGSKVNGIWPIPNTKRIVVSKQGGFQLYEVS